MVLIIAGVLLFGGAQIAYGSGVPIQLTDPPHVPAGTQALTIHYSSVQAFYVNGTGSAWASATGSGSIDLMQLQNTSTVIGTANVPNGASITKVRFNVTSATINVNGYLYDVTLPESEITSNVTSSTTVNSTSTVLLDMSPTIITVFTSNQTLFIMVPSVKGVLIGNASVRAGGEIKQWELARLHAAVPSITVTSASLAVNNQTTDLSVSVTNNGNKTVTLGEVVLFGNESANVPALINVSANAGIGVGLDQATLHSDAEANARIAERFGFVSFIVLSNGSLVTSDSQCTPMRDSEERWRARCPEFEASAQGSAQGLVLQPGQSATLTFDNEISMGYGMWVVTPDIGSTYQVGVIGSDDAHASTTTTAT